MDFFNPTCQEPPRNDKEFGLCDDQNGTKAYTNTNNPIKWVATVKNDNNVNLIFTAIDACVIKSWEQPGKGRCDGMLTSENHLFFVELKEMEPPWRAHAINQLVSTIQIFKANHSIDNYRHRKVFACNKKRPYFEPLENEFSQRFFKEHEFRIDVHAKIVVV